MNFKQTITGYNSLTGVGNLKGSDINWQNYKVIKGKVTGLLLNKGELEWLKQAWEQATGKKPV
jgi:hypothetical protein